MTNVVVAVAFCQSKDSYDVYYKMYDIIWGMIQEVNA